MRNITSDTLNPISPGSLFFLIIFEVLMVLSWSDVYQWRLDTTKNAMSSMLTHLA